MVLTGSPVLAAGAIATTGGGAAEEEGAAAAAGTLEGDLRGRFWMTTSGWRKVFFFVESVALRWREG